MPIIIYNSKEKPKYLTTQDIINKLKELDPKNECKLCLAGEYYGDDLTVDDLNLFKRKGNKIIISYY